MSEAIRKRSEIEEKYKWDLTHIYPSDDAWQADYERVSGLAGKLAAMRGTTADNPRRVIKAFFDVQEQLLPVYEYAFLRKETDNADPAAQGLKDRAVRLAVQVQTAGAFLEPELLEMEESTLKALAEDPEMRNYDAFLRSVLLNKPHTLSSEQEQLVAMMGEVMEAPDAIFTALSEADMKLPPIKGADGTEMELTEGNYSAFIHHRDRTIREQAFKNLMTAYDALGNTFAAIYGASVRKDQFMADSHHYASARQAAMEPLEIPEAVYDNLISAVHDALPALQDYLRLRKKTMGLEELHLYDLYVPMTDGFDMKLPYGEAFELVLQGLKPMGEDYLEKLREARDQRWIDVFPSRGKSSGAFSAGDLQKVHPYVLLNHNDNLDSAFTIAHELGHSMHSYYSNMNQPFPRNDYSLFVAEVASICNECVMMRSLLNTTTDRKTRSYLLNHFLEQFRTTCFRQTMFAEFEKISHEMAQEGIPLTKESLSEKYYELNRTYYGETCVVDPEISAEWMRIPHFYRAFYVYVYATGLCAAVSLSDKIMTEGETAIRNYRKFLSAGCSVPPIEALKLAGIDMSSPEPIRRAMTVFRETVQKMKEVLE